MKKEIIKVAPIKDIKEVKDILEYNISLAKQYLKDEHTKDFKLETNGLIEGYRFALMLLNKVK